MTLHIFFFKNGKALMLGKIEGRKRKGMTEDGMVGWHHQLNEHECDQILGDSEGQGSLVCSRPWSHKESDLVTNPEE